MIALILALLQATAPLSDREVQQAQVAMLNRVTQAAEAYRKKIGLEDRFRWYCQLKLNRELEHPVDGSTPFGRDYHAFTDRDDLQLTLRAREQFETSYLILCMADAKRTLDSVSR